MGHSSTDFGQHRFAVGNPRTMRKQHLRKKRRTAPKTVLRVPDLDQAKSAVLNSLTSADAQRDIGSRLTSSWNGIALNRDCHSVEVWCCDIAFTWRAASSPPALSTCD